MSEAATHVLSPISNTAQSSPTGTSTSGGAGGRGAETLRRTSGGSRGALCRSSRGARRGATPVAPEHVAPERQGRGPEGPLPQDQRGRARPYFLPGGERCESH